MGTEFINKIKNFPTDNFIKRNSGNITKVIFDGNVIWTHTIAFTLDKNGLGEGTYEKPYFSVTPSQKVSGKIKNTNLIKSISIDGKTVQFDSNGYFNTTVNISTNQKTYIEIKVTDAAGNASSEYIYYFIDNTVKKILQVYPSDACANQLYTWMVTNGYGKGILSIDSVAWDIFMNNPNGYLKSGNTYKYDVVVLGTWDANNFKDWTQTGLDALCSYMDAGYGLICGHDVITDAGVDDLYPTRGYYRPYSYTINLNSIATRLGLTTPNDAWQNVGGNVSNRVKIVKTGLFTTYPWNIGGEGTVLNIPEAHNVSQQVGNGTIWLKFVDDTTSARCGANSNFYLATYKNSAIIMTGHSNGQASDDEQKIWANLLMFLSLRRKSEEICGIALE